MHIIDHPLCCPKSKELWKNREAVCLIVKVFICLFVVSLCDRTETKLCRRASMRLPTRGKQDSFLSDIEDYRICGGTSAKETRREKNTRRDE